MSVFIISFACHSQHRWMPQSHHFPFSSLRGVLLCCVRRIRRIGCVRPYFWAVRAILALVAAFTHAHTHTYTTLHKYRRLRQFERFDLIGSDIDLMDFLLLLVRRLLMQATHSGAAAERFMKMSSLLLRTLSARLSGSVPHQLNRINRTRVQTRPAPRKRTPSDIRYRNMLINGASK